MHTNNTQPVYWLSPVPVNDDFGYPIDKVFYDGKTNSFFGYKWAIMSQKAFTMNGLGTGLGKGQKYEKQPDGRWLKTKG